MSEISACVSAFLTQEITRYDVKYLLAMGNVAAQALLSETGVTRLRGVWYRLNSDKERWVMVTFHPAYVGYQGLDSLVATQFREDIMEWGRKVIA